MTEFREFDREPKSSNYKKWAFKLFIYMFALNGLTFYMSYKGGYELYAILICGLLALLLLIVGSVLTIMSIKNKEKKDYQYYTSTIGYSVFIILRISLMIYYLKDI